MSSHSRRGEPSDERASVKDVCDGPREDDTPVWIRWGRCRCADVGWTDVGKTEITLMEGEATNTLDDDEPSPLVRSRAVSAAHEEHDEDDEEETTEDDNDEDDDEEEEEDISTVAFGTPVSACPSLFPLCSQEKVG